ncbi:MAG TPA: hypothetical protein VJ249_07980 [Candidatus Bathyarchaeia archaeon]|nr:hypothetical protein [Candidatus Bathyarchaeia archaeon]
MEMNLKSIASLVLPIFLLSSIIMFSVVSAAEERKVLGRSYVGLGVEVHAPLQCDAGEIITVNVRIEALEDVKNASVTLFIWGSKSEGYTPWGTSFTVLDVTDFPTGTIKKEAYNITMPSDIDLGLTYGILFLDWSIYRTLSWEPQWDKASFRATYVKSPDYENLQDKYNQLGIELQNSRITAYIFLATTIALVVSTVYVAKKRK